MSARRTASDRSRWRQEFPYHWDTDEIVNRRELVRFAVLTSGALFLGTVALGILARVTDRVSGSRRAIARAADVPVGAAHYFRYPGASDQAVLLHLPDGSYAAYSQKCTHLSCAVFYQAERGRLYCPCHEGVFDAATGQPTAGPPQRRLPQIILEEEGGMLFAREMRP